MSLNKQEWKFKSSMCVLMKLMTYDGFLIIIVEHATEIWRKKENSLMKKATYIKNLSLEIPTWANKNIIVSKYQDAGQTNKIN